MAQQRDDEEMEAMSVPESYPSFMDTPLLQRDLNNGPDCDELTDSSGLSSNIDDHKENKCDVFIQYCILIFMIFLASFFAFLLGHAIAT